MISNKLKALFFSFALPLLLVSKVASAEDLALKNKIFDNLDDSDQALVNSLIEEFTEGSLVEEIVVVATRREEYLQDIPIAVSVIDKEDIETIKPRNLLDFSGLAPNVHIGESGAHPAGGAIFIRGQGYQDIEKTQNPPVGVVFDGIALGVSTGTIIDAFDIEQIEISRGPQGIFFGKNTTGGVINVRRSRPTGEFGGKASIAYGSNETYVAKGIYNMPLGDRGGLKIGATYNENEGFTNNVFTGRKVGGWDYSAITIAVDLEVSDYALLEFTYDHNDLDGGGTPTQFGNRLFIEQNPGDGFESLPTFNPVTGSPIGLGPREISSDFEDKSGLEADIINMTWIIDSPIGKITSISGYLDSEDFQNQDFDGTCLSTPGCPSTGAQSPLGPQVHSERPQAHSQFSQEIRLAGSTLDNTLDYLAGIYYYDEDIDLKQTTNSIIELTAGQETESYSIFGNVDFNINDQLTVSGGVRYINEEKEFFNGTSLTNGTVVIATFNEKDRYEDVITRLAVDWTPIENTLLYASRAEGYRSGGFSIRGTLSEQNADNTNCTPAGAATSCPENNFLAFDPESVTTYETGIKTSLLDNQLTVNAALFYSEIEDLQLTTVIVTPADPLDTNTYINNIPEATIHGAELEAFYEPSFAAGLELALTLGVTDGEVTDGNLPENRLGIGPIGQAGDNSNQIDLFRGSNFGLGRITDYNYNVSALYAFTLGDGEMTLKTNYNYLDDHGLSASRGERDIEKGYGLLNAYIGYAINNYTISLSGRNLTNEDYRTASLPAAAFNIWADERNFLFEVQAEF